MEKLPTQDTNPEAGKEKIDGLDYMYEEIIATLFLMVKNWKQSKYSLIRNNFIHY